MTILVTPQTEVKLRERASREGRDPDDLAESVLAAYLDGRIGRIGPDIPFVDDEDYAALDKLIAEGEADFAAGRFKTLEQVRSQKSDEFGIIL